MKKFFHNFKWLLASTALFIFPPVVNAQVGPEEWEGTCTQSGVATIQGLRCLVGNILSVAVTLIGFAGFVMIIVGAFRYLVSGGNSKDTEKAKNTLTFAVIGLIVALSAYVILFLISEFTGVETIMNFSIPEATTTI